MAAWGAFQARRATNPSARLGQSEKGVAEQGTRSLCSPALTSLPPAIPVSPSVRPWPPPARRLLQAFLCHLPGSRTGSWCLVARAFFPGGLSPFHKKEILCFVQARKMLVLLPDIMETLQNANTDNKTKALLLFRNVMGPMKRKEASPTALQLVEKLLPLFDDVRLLWEPEPH